MSAAPPAVAWLNYSGDTTAALDVGDRMGPNTIGEYLWVVSASYDPTADRTRVGLTYLNPKGWSR